MQVMIEWKSEKTEYKIRKKEWKEKHRKKTRRIYF